MVKAGLSPHEHFKRTAQWTRQTSSALQARHALASLQIVFSATESAEGELFAMGFTDFRVRWYAGAARLQFPAVQLPRVLERREEILTKLKKYYPAVLLDLEVRG